jgi:hypothetical protein
MVIIWTMTYLLERCGKTGIRGGLEAMETVSIMPMSLMNSLRGPPSR